jgi:23S rRNA pseudouridine1911/1915/1917 synthase
MCTGRQMGRPGCEPGARAPDELGMSEEVVAVVGAADEGPAQALVRRLTGLSNAVVRGLFEHGCVLRDDVPCHDPGTRLVTGERLVLRFERGRRYRGKPRARPNSAFRLVHEDPYLVVVDKRSGVLTVPNHGEPDTLIGAVSAYLGRGRRRAPYLQVVHRLDRDTSGLLVIARTDEAAHGLKRQLAAHTPERIYHALVAGRLARDSGTFRSNLATDAALNQRSTGLPGVGKAAVTHYRVLSRVAGATAVEVRLETGRRNQIRVHFSEAGHPVLGDLRYTPEQARHPHWRTKRLALHATVLGFVHPVTGRTMRFASPDPPEFAALLAAAGQAAGQQPPRARRSPR